MKIKAAIVCLVMGIFVNNGWVWSTNVGMLDLEYFRQIEERRAKEDELQIKAFVSLLLPGYKKYLDVFLILVFSDKLEKYQEVQTYKQTASHSVVFNQDAYIPDFKESTGYGKGAPISIRNDKTHSFPDADLEAAKLTILNRPEIPIGYTVKMPTGEVKGVIVNIYGGGFIKFSPQDKNHDHFLAHGIAVVTLNLLDLLPETNPNLQVTGGPKDMVSLFYDIQHACIHKFFQTLKNTPEILHTHLASLKGKPIYLMGASWGGRTAVNHSVKYPKTFSGYISHNGGLDRLKRRLISYHSHPHPELSPLHSIKLLQDPVLVIATQDDSNIPLERQLSWYKQVVKLKKENLVSLFIPVVSNKSSAAPKILEQEDAMSTRKIAITKGHGVPDGDKSIAEYIDAITSFMDRGGQPVFKSLDKWRYTKGKNQINLNWKMNEKNRDAVFITDALRFYQKDPVKNNPSNEDVWHNIYAPLYSGMTYLTTASPEEIDRFINSMTEKEISNTLRQQMPKFLQLWRELLGQYYKNILYYFQRSLKKDPSSITIEEVFPIDEIANNPEFHHVFKQKMTVHGRVGEEVFWNTVILQRLMLRYFFNGNLGPRSDIPAVAPEKLAAIRTKLLKRIADEKKHVRGVWGATSTTQHAAHKLMRPVRKMRAAGDGGASSSGAAASSSGPSASSSGPAGSSHAASHHARGSAAASSSGTAY